MTVTFQIIWQKFSRYLAIQVLPNNRPFLATSTKSGVIKARQLIFCSRFISTNMRCSTRRLPLAIRIIAIETASSAAHGKLNSCHFRAMKTRISSLFNGWISYAKVNRECNWPYPDRRSRRSIPGEPISKMLNGVRSYKSRITSSAPSFSHPNIGQLTALYVVAKRRTRLIRLPNNLKNFAK